jgi:hypothetical protein
MRSRKCLEDEKPCTHCESGVMYLCKFTEGPQLMVCDYCSFEEILVEVNTND